MPWHALEWRDSNGRLTYGAISPRREHVDDYLRGFSCVGEECPPPVVDVSVAEVPDAVAAEADYWGWHEAGEDYPCLVCADSDGLCVAFNAYSDGGAMEDAVARGDGRVVRLRVTPVATQQPTGEP